MSYCATGEGWMILRFDDQAKLALVTSLAARYNELCQIEQQGGRLDTFQEYILHTYQKKKAALGQTDLKFCLQREFSDIGFCDISVEEQSQQLLYIEASFSDKYYEDQIISLLDALSRWTVEGEFSFRGEDDGLWRLLFTGAEWTEQRGEVSYMGQDTSSECQEGPYPALVEDVGTFEALLSEVETQLKSDDRPAPQRGRQLMMAFKNQDPDGVLMALTGWSLRSLGALAGIWQSADN